MLDLLGAQKTGELTTDALESFMVLHGTGGRAFGPRGGAGTLTAGGKRPKSNLFTSFGSRKDTPTASEVAENERVGRLIAGGHASLKHMYDDFPDMRTLDDLAQHISEVVTPWTARKDFTNSDRTLYWHEPSGTAVWRNPATRDGGSAFRPPDRKKYFDRQIK